MVCCREEWFAFDLFSSGQSSDFSHNLIEWTYWENRARTMFLCDRETGLALQGTLSSQIPCVSFLFEGTGNCAARRREGSRGKEIRYQPPSLWPICVSSACEQTMRYQRSRGIGSLLLGHLMGPQNRKHGNALTNKDLDWMEKSQSLHSILRRIARITVGGRRYGHALIWTNHFGRWQSYRFDRTRSCLRLPLFHSFSNAESDISDTDSSLSIDVLWSWTEKDSSPGRLLDWDLAFFWTLFSCIGISCSSLTKRRYRD